ncbi:MAG: acyl-CoA dehydrogenase family protein [Endozoicomonas sp.]
MDFSYTEEQQMLKDSISRFVQNDYDFFARADIVASEQGYSKEHWQLFAELGWLMTPFSEEDGGFGGSAVDLLVVMEELGKGIVIEPFLATAVIGGGLIAEAGSPAQKEELLGELMAGTLQLAYAQNEPGSRYNLASVETRAEKTDDNYIINGHKAVVLNAPIADKFIVSVRTSGDRLEEDGISLLLVDANTAGVRLNSYKTVDGGRAAEVFFENVSVSAASLLGEEGKALPVMAAVQNRAILAACAEAVGNMEVTYRKTVEYAQTRRQFGVSIGRFQALQHRMVDMFMEHETAKSILLMAAMKLDAGEDVEQAIAAAKSRISRAARIVGQEAVQIHGGIGVTEELDVGHYFKRLTTLELMFGNSSFHTRRFAELSA